MITSAGVRPGNKVLHNASGAVATVIHVDNNVIELDCFPGSIQCIANDISGIELTRDMLRKLLFSNDIEPNRWSGHGINLEKKPDGFYYGLRIEKNRTKIKHLHQLQNYVQDFYALFREADHSLNTSALAEIEDLIH